jgi:vacuolar-type H+-ATPase subunit I/STV1
MNLKNAIESLRSEIRKFKTQKQSFADYKLTDGTVVRVDGDLVAGTAVYVVAEDGTLPAPDGEHVVEGVGTIKTEGGKIVEVIVAAPVAETVVAAEVTPEITEEVVETIIEEYPNVTPQKVEEIVEEKLLEISEELKEVVAEMRKVKSKMESFALHMITMADIVEKVSELPTETPKTSGSAIVEQRKAQASQNFNALAQALQSLKSKK